MEAANLRFSSGEFHANQVLWSFLYPRVSSSPKMCFLSYLFLFLWYIAFSKTVLQGSDFLFSVAHTSIALG